MKVYVIGRSPQIQPGEISIVLNDPSNTISKTHCRITQIDNQTFLIEDLGSKNGTLVNNTTIGQPTQIYLNDTIQLPSDVSFSVNDVITGVNLNPQKPAKENIEFEKGGNQPEPARAIHPQKDRPFKNEAGPERHPPQQPIKPASPVIPSVPAPAVASTGGIGITSIMAIAAVAVVAVVTAYFVSNLESSNPTIGKSGGNISETFSAPPANWNSFDNGIIRFSYPNDWEIVYVPGETAAVGNTITNEGGFAVSWVICQSRNDAYSAFDCELVNQFKKDPKSVVSIGFESNYSLYTDLSQVKGKQEWSFITYGGVQETFFGISSQNRPTHNQRKFQFAAASLVRPSVLLTAAGGCIEDKRQEYEVIFHQILQTIEYLR